MTGKREGTVLQALSAVMEQVRKVGKDDRNTQQNYNFRGVDAVVNAVGPVLREFGVVVVPLGGDANYRDVQTSTGKPSRECTVKWRYRWYGPMGDFIDTEVPGESMDSGDKGTPKAMSVAYRTLLIQALCIPTGDRDPDADTYERANEQPAPDPRVPLYSEIKGLGHAKKWTDNEIADDFAQWSLGVHISSADVEQLEHYIAYLKQPPEAPDDGRQDRPAEPLRGTIATPTDAAAAAERLRARASGARLQPAKSQRLATAQSTSDVAAADGPSERQTT